MISKGWKRVIWVIAIIIGFYMAYNEGCSSFMDSGKCFLYFVWVFGISILICWIAVYVVVYIAKWIIDGFKS